MPAIDLTLTFRFEELIAFNLVLLFFRSICRLSLVALLVVLSVRFTFSFGLFLRIALLLRVRLPQLDVLVLVLSFARELEFRPQLIEPTLGLNLRPFLPVGPFSVSLLVTTRP